jgi:hypothetical protein
MILTENPYLIPLESILSKLPVVPIGDMGTIPFAMRQNARDFVDSAFDTTERLGDGSQQPVDSDRDLTPTVTTGQASTVPVSLSISSESTGQVVE